MILTIDIGNSNDSSRKWDFLTFQAAWIPRSVPLFVVCIRYFCRDLKSLFVLKNLPADLRMRLHNLEFVRGKRTRQVKNAVRNADFADIVHR